MKIEKRDGGPERRILIGMATDAEVLSRLASRWEPMLFRSRWANLVAQWCVDYCQKYGRPPGRDLEGIFEAWEVENADKETCSLVQRFLTSLSEEYEQKGGDNPQYLIDLAGKYFNSVKLSRLAEQLQDDIEGGDVDEALKRVHTFGRVEVGPGSHVDVLQDREAIRSAFEEGQEDLIELPGAYGEFFRGTLHRDGFVSFLAPEKRGKSWLLMDIAWRAMLQRKRVAFFSVGDMSQSQVMKRFMIRAARHPVRPCVARIPRTIDLEGNRAEVTFRERSFDLPLDWRKAAKSAEEVMKTKVRSKKSYLRLACYPNSTVNVNGLRSVLQEWERSEWVPDLCIIDYADILAPLNGRDEVREQINATWKALRALSQSLHCLVITATQADAASYQTETVTRQNFSEDKRKLAHVTAMIGISQTREEKELGILRLNYVAAREREYSEYRCCHLAGCLAIGNPAILSAY